MSARNGRYRVALVIMAMLITMPAARAAAQTTAFITVGLGAETRAADKALRDYLHDQTQLQFDPE